MRELMGVYVMQRSMTDVQTGRHVERQAGRKPGGQTDKQRAAKLDRHPHRQLASQPASQTIGEATSTARAQQ